MHLVHVKALGVLGASIRDGREEIDDVLFGRWRGTVDPGDSVACLGDVAGEVVKGRTTPQAPAAVG